QIQQDQIRQRLASGRQPLFARAGGGDRVVILHEVVLQDLGDIGLVLNDQDALCPCSCAHGCHSECLTMSPVRMYSTWSAVSVARSAARSRCLTRCMVFSATSTWSECCSITVFILRVMAR